VTRQILALAVLSIALAACGQEPAPAEAVAEPEIPLAAETTVPTHTELPVTRIDSVMISRPDNAPGSVVIQVAGSVGSVGWTDAKLVPAETEPTPTMRSFHFVATSPDLIDANAAPQPIEVRTEFDAFPTDVQTVRILSATNEVMAIVGY